MTPPWWRPDRLAQRRANLAVRARLLGAVRDFFAAAGYLEVDTPALQASPGLEPHLKAFATVLHDPRDEGFCGHLSVIGLQYSFPTAGNPAAGNKRKRRLHR